MNAHAKRRARTKRRFGAIGAIFHAIGVAAEVRDAAVAAGENLTPEELHRRVQQRLEILPLPTGALGPNETLAELKTARVGQRRSKGRPAKPANTNDAVVALLQEHRPDDFKGRFTLARAEATRKWLKGRKIPKSTDAVTKLVNRAKRRK